MLNRRGVMSVCSDGQKKMYMYTCRSLRLEYINGNHSSHVWSSLYWFLPSATVQIKADRNCLFRSISARSQDYHHEIHLLITTCMIHNSSKPKPSCLLPASESMECHVKCSKIQSLEIKIIATACLMQPCVTVKKSLEA